MKKILKETSFISTVFNEEDSILEFLESLKSQTVLPGDIIIVDGGSKDSTFSKMEGFFSEWAGEKESPVYMNSGNSKNRGAGKEIAVKLIKKEGAGISEGRNIAVKEASGVFISVSDAGCILDPAWLEEINRDIDKDSGTVNGGMNYPVCGKLLQNLLALCIMPGLNETGRESFMPSSRNICFRKAHWVQVGGYPEELDFGEDMKFNFNLKDQGYGLRFCPRASVYWKMRNNFASIFRQFFRYAKGDALGRMYPSRHMVRFISGAVFAAILLAGIMVSPWILFLFIILGAVYCFRPYYRLFIRWEGNESCRPAGIQRLAALVFIPFLLIYIDSAKVFGYLYGIFKK